MIVDPQRRTETYALAGPPSARRTTENSVLGGRPWPPLGIFTDARYTTWVIQAARGDVVLLYMDGLIECRNEIIDRGMQRHPTLLTTRSADDLDELAACVPDSTDRPLDNVDVIAAGFADRWARSTAPLSLWLSPFGPHRQAPRRAPPSQYRPDPA